MDTAFQQGYRAYHQGKSTGSNPFRPGTQDYDDWLEGWMEAGGRK